VEDRVLATLLSLPAFRWATLMVAAVGGRSERDLVTALQAGDQRAWRDTLETYGPMLIGYATRLLKRRDAAEEAVQEAIVSVHSGMHRFEGRCSVKSWLFRAVHNKAIDELRRNKRYVTPSDNEDGRWEDRFDTTGAWTDPPRPWVGSMGAQIDARRVLEAVQQTLPSLPHNHQQVLLMKEVHGLSSDEICDILGISSANLRVSLHRARRALRQAVEPLLEERAS